MSGGKDISYPSAEGGYSEENLPTEGTLDDTAAGSIGGESANALDNQTEIEIQKSLEEQNEADGPVFEINKGPPHGSPFIET